MVKFQTEVIECFFSIHKCEPNWYAIILYSYFYIYRYMFIISMFRSRCA